MAVEIRDWRQEMDALANEKGFNDVVVHLLFWIAMVAFVSTGQLDRELFHSTSIRLTKID